MAALDAGATSVRFTGPPETRGRLEDIAAQGGARITDSPLPEPDLHGVPDAEGYCRDLLRDT